MTLPSLYWNTPIWRFYTNRHHQNDGNHRLTPFGDCHRPTLLAQGWIDEGVVMCVVS